MSRLKIMQAGTRRHSGDVTVSYLCFHNSISTVPTTPTFLKTLTKFFVKKKIPYLYVLMKYKN